MEPGVRNPVFFVGSAHSMLGICPVLRVVLFRSFLGSRKVSENGSPNGPKKGPKKKEKRERREERERERERDRGREREREKVERERESQKAFSGFASCKKAILLLARRAMFPTFWDALQKRPPEGKNEDLDLHGCLSFRCTSSQVMI